jgi:hypothetical protein
LIYFHKISTFYFLNSNIMETGKRLIIKAKIAILDELLEEPHRLYA